MLTSLFTLKQRIHTQTAELKSLSVRCEINWMWDIQDHKILKLKSNLWGKKWPLIVAVLACRYLVRQWNKYLRQFFARLHLLTNILFAYKWWLALSLYSFSTVSFKILKLLVLCSSSFRKDSCEKLSNKI